jgi:hypothetical protein
LDPQVHDALARCVAAVFHGSRHPQERNQKTERHLATPGVIKMKQGRSTRALTMRLCIPRKHGSIRHIQNVTKCRDPKGQQRIVQEFLQYLMRRSLLWYAEGAWHLDQRYMEEQRAYSQRSYELRTAAHPVKSRPQLRHRRRGALAFG